MTKQGAKTIVKNVFLTKKQHFKTIKNHYMQENLLFTEKTIIFVV
jgi:hypothetical protein